MNAISHWPVAERPREKLLAKGASALSDAELLAIFLRTGVVGKTALDLARDLLQEHRGLAGVLAASPDEFCRTSGIGIAKYSQLQATLEMGQRYWKSKLEQGSVLSSPEVVKRFLHGHLRRYSREVFMALFVDSQNCLLASEELFLGTINESPVYIRVVLEKALQHKAAAVLFAHNHPSGNARPSASDIAITKRLQEALALLDIRLLDHVVIGAGEACSMREQSLL